MQRKFIKTIVTVAVAGSVISACGGESRTSAHVKAAKSAGDDLVPMEVTYADGDAQSAGFALSVSDALAGYKAELVGGVDCWGVQASPYIYNSTQRGKTLAVRRYAQGCKLNFTEITIKKPNAILLKASNGGLLSTATTGEQFASERGETVLSMKVGTNFTTNINIDPPLADGTPAPIKSATVALLGRLTESQTEPTVFVDATLPLASTGDILAAPSVVTADHLDRFLGKIYFKVKCSANGAAGMCHSNVISQDNMVERSAGDQDLSKMDAAIIVLKGAMTEGFPKMITSPNLDTIIASKSITLGGVAIPQLVSNWAPASSTFTAPFGDFKAEFNALVPPAAFADGDKAIVVVRYKESGRTSYKAFLSETMYPAAAAAH